MASAFADEVIVNASTVCTRWLATVESISGTPGPGPATEAEADRR
jgi:hypothetical protein